MSVRTAHHEYGNPVSRAQKRWCTLRTAFPSTSLVRLAKCALMVGAIRGELPEGRLKPVK